MWTKQVYKNGNYKDITEMFFLLESAFSVSSLWTTAKHHDFSALNWISSNKNFIPKYFYDALIDFCSNVTNIKAAVEGASSLERFWEKNLPVQRNTSKICNDVISACYENASLRPDEIKLWLTPIRV